MNWLKNFLYNWLKKYLTTELLPCETCGGAGTLTICESCKGNKVCIFCHGTGEATYYEATNHSCSDCGGSGDGDFSNYIPSGVCSSCGGSGSGGESSVEKTKKCKNCEREGFSSGICPRCNGYGVNERECPDCKGNGVIAKIKTLF